MSEEFLTPSHDYFLPPMTQGRSELEVKITAKMGMKPVSRTLDISCTTCGFIMLSFDLKKSCRKWENDFLLSSSEITSTNKDFFLSQTILI